jgi:hypothetical protein
MRLLLDAQVRARPIEDSDLDGRLRAAIAYNSALLRGKVSHPARGIGSQPRSGMSSRLSPLICPRQSSSLAPKGSTACFQHSRIWSI